MPALFLSWLLLATPQHADPPAPLDSPALVIDGEPISRERFGAWLVREQGEAHAEVFANHVSVARAASTAGVSVAPEEIDSRARSEMAARVQGAFGGDRDGWVAELATLGTDETGWLARRRVELTDELLLERWIQSRRRIEESDVRAEWERRYGPGGRAIRVRALSLRYVVPSAEGSVDFEERMRREQAVQAEIVSRLASLRSRVLAGEDFTSLALAEGEDADAARGSGPWLEPLRWERWPAAVQDELAKMPVGEISAPLYGRGAFHLFQIVDETITPLEEVSFALTVQMRVSPADGAEVRAGMAELRAAEPLVEFPAMLSEATDPGEIVLQVGSIATTRGEYASWLAPRVASRAARSFVERHLCEREASRAGITITESEVGERVDRSIHELVERAHGGDFEKWHTELAQRGMREERLRRGLAVRARLDLHAERILLARRVVTEDQVLALHRERYGEDGRRLDLRLLGKTIPLPADPLRRSPEEREAERRAAAEELGRTMRALRERALENGEDFGALARAESDDGESAARGGRPAGAFPWERFPEAMRKTIRALEPGQIAGPLEVGDEIWLVELAGAEPMPYASASAALRDELASRPPTPLECARFLEELVTGSVWTLTALSPDD